MGLSLAHHDHDRKHISILPLTQAGAGPASLSAANHRLNIVLRQLRHTVCTLKVTVGLSWFDRLWQRLKVSAV
jgi:hypothetical protein